MLGILGSTTETLIRFFAVASTTTKWFFNKTKLFAYLQNITPLKVPFLHASTKGVWHVIAWCTNNASHLSNMLAWDSVILLLLATKTIRIYLFTSPLVRYRRIEPKKYSRSSRMLLQEPSRYCHSVDTVTVEGRFRRWLSSTQNRDKTPSIATRFARWVYNIYFFI